ncbi:MAG: glutamine--fructose-6-phosphate transaminase (isomerizing) [Betaproteobacteria bacterium]|nr:glutamine--fructose-6-phosphate transaminase (isomerizing) [Pseudomonadota bacterium]NCV14145.1 glutamine--fructose-6-phosphate transaminase (isomerizing) [Betaproteobacteria bacterium]NCW24510.1 glutamine--fructose-6-phosphate transaminase (isomerizing) [Betaproteobacteria bacterium]NCY07207.1 glutamine--fructose-6-phosphate transaminase (isomerizing) [Betaproteobacteria bacterium]NDA92440.1 glutamine--fructose-6-phosphate transaminase (isomerizing) [Betaproteobacteria bacterium]
MCGIVAATSASRDIIGHLLQGLERLEYRGYDSAGLAYFSPEHRRTGKATVPSNLRRLRAVGRVSQLKRIVDEVQAEASCGIAHTRWATHGSVTEDNAHPHLSQAQGVAVCVVHNGIIENHQVLREALLADGYAFSSQTDTEVIAHLLHQALLDDKQTGGVADLFGAMCRVAPRLRGAYALAAVCSVEPEVVVGTRWGAPLLLGYDAVEGAAGGERFLASDVSALIQSTRQLSYLEEGDVVEIRPGSHQIVDRQGQAVSRALVQSRIEAKQFDLGGFQHYMQKEIFEQPSALANTLEMVHARQALTPELFGHEAQAVVARTRQILILACGTSYHAGCVARYWLESIAHMPTQVEIASEYRYRASVPLEGTLVITISQSGETADTLAALEHAQALGMCDSLSICNVPESSLIRASRLRFLTRAGPEIGVASTKAFTTQLAALFLLALVIAKARGRLSMSDEQTWVEQLRHLPAAMNEVLACEQAMIEWAQHFAARDHALFLGRGVHYPIAMEGALKLKEVSYIHAESYAAGELKHGPLALVDEAMPVLAVAPQDALISKLQSNLEEVRARGGRLFVIADRDSAMVSSDGLQIVKLTDHAGLLSPILHVLPLQLLAYHTALVRGTDVDKPRNLAKSVTVE